MKRRSLDANLCYQPPVMSLPERFENVTAVCRANIYFDGRVVSHTILFADGSKKTLGVVFPGSFRFTTGAPERMEITAGSCRAVLPTGEVAVNSGGFFDVPGNSEFTIVVEGEPAQYICSFF
jgi:purine/pyrimidine-nucleoside phosphorylase